MHANFGPRQQTKDSLGALPSKGNIAGYAVKYEAHSQPGGFVSDACAAELQLEVSAMHKLYQAVV